MRRPVAQEQAQRELPQVLRRPVLLLYKKLETLLEASRSFAKMATLAR